MRYFEINPETEGPTLTVEAKGIEPFKTLWRRLRRMKGDADGRKKMLNEMECLFAYYSCNYDSNLKYVDAEQKEVLLRARLGLPDDWKPDDLVLEAIKVIEEGQVTETSKLYHSAVNAAMAMKVWYDDLANDIKKNPKNYSIKTMNEFQDGFNELPKTIENLNSLREKVYAEQESKRTTKGRLISKFEIDDIAD